MDANDMITFDLSIVEVKLQTEDHPDWLKAMVASSESWLTRLTSQLEAPVTSSIQCCR